MKLTRLFFVLGLCLVGGLVNANPPIIIDSTDTEYPVRMTFDEYVKFHKSRKSNKQLREALEIRLQEDSVITTELQLKIKELRNNIDNVDQTNNELFASYEKEIKVYESAIEFYEQDILILENEILTLQESVFWLKAQRIILLAGVVILLL